MALSLREKAYQVIRQRLVNADLRPGSRVSEKALSKELAMSRAPVREAVNRLVSEGLLEQIPNEGSFVTKPDRTDLADLYQLREWLETCAATEAARRVTEQHLVELKRACEETLAVARLHRQSGARTLGESLYCRYTVADLAYHSALIRASGNRRAMKIIADQHVISRVFGFVSERLGLHDVVRCWREHVRILRAVSRGDAKDARKRLRRHIRHGREVVLAWYDWEERQLAAREQPELFSLEALGEMVGRVEQDQDHGVR